MENNVIECQFIGTKKQEDLFLKIMSWDLTREKQYLLNRQGYLEANHLDEMEAEYKKFMFLLTTYPEHCIPISEEVDDLWHAHVLHTSRYYDFCNNICGRIINHNPTITDSENYDLMPYYLTNTLVLYEKHFGRPIAKFWVDISPQGACCTH